MQRSSRRIPLDELSLLRDTLRSDVLERFKLNDGCIHPRCMRVINLVMPIDTVSDSQVRNVIEGIYKDDTTVTDSTPMLPPRVRKSVTRRTIKMHKTFEKQDGIHRDTICSGISLDTPRF
jgi:hypothetical protein